MRGATWDYGDVWDGPWSLGTEPREDGRVAIKSGVFTIFTVGDYFDGGGPIEERLRFICDAANEKIAHDGPLPDHYAAAEARTWGDAPPPPSSDYASDHR